MLAEFHWVLVLLVVAYFYKWLHARFLVEVVFFFENASRSQG